MTSGARAWYGDNDPSACAWLRELIAADLITPGTVDPRSIADVRPTDLADYQRCHFFAGIAGWDLALQLAGWPADRSVWTGSCPCQPFSAAGKGEGEADSRHLWPAWFSLVRECRPDCCFGEQVASADGYRWLDGVRTDLESEGYAVGAADLPAACVGAPHIRQRLFWVAGRVGQSRNANGQQPGNSTPADAQGQGRRRAAEPRVSVATGDPSHTPRRRLRPRVGDAGSEAGTDQHRADAERYGEHGGTPDADGGQPRHGRLQRGGQHGQQPQDGGADAERSGDFWSKFDIIHYRDGKARRVEPGTFPLADGVPGRVGLLRGYGNAIVPQVAALFVRAFLDAEGGAP